MSSAKQPETRRRRIEKACDMLVSGKRRLCCFPGIEWLMKKDAKSCGMWLPLPNSKNRSRWKEPIQRTHGEAGYGNGRIGNHEPSTHEMNKKIEKAVLASLRQAVAIHVGTARPAKGYTMAYTARRLPAIPAPRFTAARIVALRHAMKCSQPAFASLLNVSAPTVRARSNHRLDRDRSSCPARATAHSLIVIPCSRSRRATAR
jgi:DNA-binding transcriptional regulator YiaG